MGGTESLEALVKRAETSGDGEAYARVAAGSGFRIGMGARRDPGRRPVLFVEVVLDLFPDRPKVDSTRWRRQSEQVAQLEARGYEVRGDDDGTVICERVLDGNRMGPELEAVTALFGPRQGD